MSTITTVSPLRQRMSEDMTAPNLGHGPLNQLGCKLRKKRRSSKAA
jgi:hypothetical protein